MAKQDLDLILSDAKKYYIKYSMEYTSDLDMKKTIQTLGIVLMFYQNSMEEKYVIRDTRNLIYDLVKEVKVKEGKKLVKGLLKIIK